MTARNPLTDALLPLIGQTLTGPALLTAVSVADQKRMADAVAHAVADRMESVLAEHAYWTGPSPRGAALVADLRNAFPSPHRCPDCGRTLFAGECPDVRAVRRDLGWVTR